MEHHSHFTINASVFIESVRQNRLLVSLRTARSLRSDSYIRYRQVKTLMAKGTFEELVLQRRLDSVVGGFKGPSLTDEPGMRDYLKVCSPELSSDGLVREVRQFPRFLEKQDAGEEEKGELMLIEHSASSASSDPIELDFDKADMRI